jgi:hypothetical protein
MAGFDRVVRDLQRTAQYLEQQLQAVRTALSSLGGGGGAGRGRRGRPKGTTGLPRRKRKLSADARRRISEAQKARWARQRAKAGKK